MISVNVWKLRPVMPTPRPSRGPAIQLGQPPLRPGTNCEGRVAAPAATRKTLVTTPTRPAEPRARRAPAGRSPIDLCARAAPPVPSGAPPTSTRGIGLAACIGSLLRLLRRQACGALFRQGCGALFRQACGAPDRLRLLLDAAPAGGLPPVDAHLRRCAGRAGARPDPLCDAATAHPPRAGFPDRGVC